MKDNDKQLAIIKGDGVLGSNSDVVQDSVTVEEPGKMFPGVIKLS